MADKEAPVSETALLTSVPSPLGMGPHSSASLCPTPYKTQGFLLLVSASQGSGSPPFKTQGFPFTAFKTKGSVRPGTKTPGSTSPASASRGSALPVSSSQCSSSSSRFYVAGRCFITRFSAGRALRHGFSFAGHCIQGWM